MTDRVLASLAQFFRIEAVSGIVLIAAALLALLWANSPAAAAYDALWHASITLGFGGFSASPSLHFLVNEGLMTIFFLVAGLEIRRELHEGALSNVRLAALPLVAALGGVLAPALIYLGLNWHGDARQGWAVPIATDIAFAVGVLALLGRGIPAGVRVLLLAVAIIDDIVAVVVIALFYSHDLRPDGAVIGAVAIGLVLLLQRLGWRTAWVYVAPGALLWFGLLRLGVHPTLAGVVLGLLTPVVPLAARADDGAGQRAAVPPVVALEAALHPWVAYGIMPLFALANAGVALAGADLATVLAAPVTQGIAFGLLLGKPIGILLASAIVIRLGWCALPDDVGWRGLTLVALLAGIGFTMAIFIATLAFPEGAALASAKLAILMASGLAAALALAYGKLSFRR